MRINSLLAFSTLVLFACGAPKGTTSQLHDIYTDDTSTERRHKATPEETLWTVDMGGGSCTGHLLSPEHMMTAAHCSPRSGARYTSGSALVKGGRSDITVTDVIDQDSGLDYAIVGISWSGEIPADQNFPPLIPTAPEQMQISSSPESGDELFTVGFPGDKQEWGATYAQGRAKDNRNNRLYYNVGVINGNSGGGIWRKSDGALVSIVSSGPRQIGQPGWNSSDKDSPNEWNWGPAMWVVWQQSSIMQDIFPGGKNRFDSPVKPGGSADGTGILLAMQDTGDPNSAILWMSAPNNTHYAAMCLNATECRASAPEAQMSAPIRKAADRNIYSFLTATSLSAGMTITFVASDANNTLLGKRTITIIKK